MQKSVLLPICKVQLLPAVRMATVARDHGIAETIRRREWIDIPQTPGSATKSQSQSEDDYSSQLTLKCPRLDGETAALLRTLSSQPVIARYIDERGNMRLMGSRRYPLRLTYTEGSGYYTVTLKGKDIQDDPFMI